MFETIPKAESYIKNNFQVKNLKGIKLVDNFKLISLDVVSLFTNISIDVALDCVNKKWNFILNKCDFLKAEFLTTVQFVLDSIVFTFDK